MSDTDRGTVPATDAETERIEISGVVQGVGYRPFVHRLATGLGLGGHVGNDSAGVFVEVTGPGCVIDRFVTGLTVDAPPLARVDRIERWSLTGAGAARPAGFRIVASPTGPVGPGRRALVPPDTAPCEDCLTELFDPADRRHHHPFITCTNCGPRFTIITDLPYDRPNTTMAGFDLCPACAAEYHDPADRRYHAQPVCCPDCGPRLRYLRSPATGPDTGIPASPRPAVPAGGPDPFGDDPIGAAVAALAAGSVVAIKGLGGFHLACPATDPGAVARLRDGKNRPDKPFAVLVADLEQAAGLAWITAAEAAQLLSPARPIVLVRARPDSPLAEAVAPGNPLIGLLLPYTPVHHLLLDRFPHPLVLTSGNRGGEPICHRDDQVAARLGPLCDGVLTHDRPIAVPCDDSVVRLVGDVLLPVRRARGYAPVPVDVVSGDGPRRSVLAVGGELKNTFALAADGHIWVSQHLGDLADLDTLTAFESAVAHFGRLYQVDPEVVAVDAHPGHLAGSWARRTHGDRVFEVQHHHAHVAAVAAEHGLAPDQQVIGFSFDGTGFGADGAIWGGEVLVADARSASRVAHLGAVPLPGGDAAVRNPCRVALAHLWAAGIAWDDRLAPTGRFTTGELALLDRQLERGVACVPTTSMGRLFDAVASLIGLRHHISYEAQAAIDLEAAADRALRSGRLRPAGPYRFGIDGDGPVVLDPGPVLAAIVADLTGPDRLPGDVVALAFHHAVADAVAELAVRLRTATGIGTVALSGGVFQNALLTLACIERLAAAGMPPLTPHLVPANDGGLALGQAWIATNATPLPTTGPASVTGRPQEVRDVSRRTGQDRRDP